MGESTVEALGETSSKRARLLLVAYACSPDHGSEPAVGWNRALQAARFHDTWVICEERKFGPEIRAYLASREAIPGLQFEFLPMNGLELALARTNVLYYQAYNLWHRRAARLAEQLHARHQFDLVHQVNYCGFREPGYVWKLDAPFVWGPVGGAQNFPTSFLGEIGFRGACKEVVRSVLNRFQLRYRRRVRQALHRADTVLAANATNQLAIEQAHGIRPDVLLETGLASVIDDSQVAQAMPERNDFRVLWAGQFLPFKGLSLLIKALARVPDSSKIRLSVLGAGPMERSWKRLARRYGVEHRTEWLGWLPHDQALAEYQRADVMAFTSLRDTTGGVMLEGLAAGLPVVCLDHQGGREVITSDCGFLIEPKNPRQVIADLSTALLRLEQDPELRQRLANCAVRRAKGYLWNANGDQMARVYQRVLAQHAEDGRAVEPSSMSGHCLPEIATDATPSFDLLPPAPARSGGPP